VNYSAGSLFASVSTGCIPQCGGTTTLKEETQPIWWEIRPFLNDNDPTCTGSYLNQCPQITGAELVNEDCYFCAGGRSNNGSAYFATLQPDPERNVTMVLNYSDSSTSPGTAYVSRRVTQAKNTMHDTGIYLQSGLATYNFERWGDYTGTAIDLTSSTTPYMWFSGMYTTSTGNWGTRIGRNTFSSVNQP
jgi:hypothetical protein